MARHVNPREYAELTGADKKNPQRYKGDIPKSELPLGEAPEHMEPNAAKCWFELSALALPGILTGSDRIMLELVSNLLAEYRNNPCDFPVGKYTHLISILARFGMSPSDRSRLSIDKAEDKKGEFEDL